LLSPASITQPLVGSLAEIMPNMYKTRCRRTTISALLVVLILPEPSVAASANRLRRCIASESESRVSPRQEHLKLEALGWRFEGGAWTTGATSVNGEVDDTSRGFAIGEDQPLAFTLAVEAVIVPTRHVGTSWSAGGVCVYRDLGDYWRLTLVEAPDGKTRKAELLVMNMGQGLDPKDLRVLEEDPPALNWKWNTPYRLRLTLTTERIVGEVFTQDGARLWHVLYAATDAKLVHFGRMAMGLQGMAAGFRAASQGPGEGPDSPVRSRMLHQSAERSSWLILPNSRLVVNPTLSSAPALPPQLAPSLPLNLAWYFGEYSTRLPGFWSWLPGGGGRSGAGNATVVRGPMIGLSAPDELRFRAERATLSLDHGVARVRVDSTPFGSVSTDMTVDLDRTPFLSVNVPRSDGGWALKVNPGNSAVDTYVQTDTTRTGSFLYDLRKSTKWSSTRTFRLLLFALGQRGDSTHFTNLCFLGAAGSQPALRVRESEWYPHQITATMTADAEPHEQRPAADSVVFMPGESTVAQRLHLRDGAPRTLILAGELPTGTARWDVEQQVLLLQGEGFRAAIATAAVTASGRPARFLGTYASAADRVAGRSLRPGQSGRVWAVALEDLKPGDDVQVAASFGIPADEDGPLVERARASVSASGFASALQAREADWDRKLAALPHPLTFDLTSVSPHGADANLVRLAYYRAWVFLLSDTLPPMPENGYPYPQICCGKPSLWAEGTPHARPTSQWESVLGMQYTALVDMDTAWAALEGLLSQVDAFGVLAGEGLPTRFAQTAWTLYSLTGDRTRLARIYPAVKRLLLWKAQDPRWLYKGSTPPGQKDAEFVVHVLMDMGFARKIAAELDVPGEAPFWEERAEAMAADFHHWFWDASATHTWRLFRSDTVGAGTREEPDRMWNLQGLALPASHLQEKERDTYLRMFRAGLDRQKEDIPFLIPELAAFPKYNYTLVGVWQYGSSGDAERMAEAAQRETALAGEFSENYTQQFPPVPAGVVPSLFGALQAIDAAFWRNGLRLGEGLPRPIPMPHAVGMWNVQVRGEHFELLFDNRSNRLEMQGRALGRLAVPVGVKSSLLTNSTPRWIGPLPPRTGLILTAKP
jgi:hypothetical protein